MEETGEKEKGLKRSADSQVPEEEQQQGSSSASSSEGDTQPAKRPALTSSFSFRPSPLHKATQGLILRQSTLTPPSSSTSGPSAAPDEKASAPRPSPQVGFLKLDNSELKPVLVSSAPPPATATNGSATLNHTENKSGSFTSFIQSASTVPTFSSLSTMTGATFGRDERAKDGKKEKEDEEEEEGSEDGKVGGGGDEGGGENKVGGGSGSSSVPVLLPEVQRVTGEEGENKIVQINARLYAFDAATHSWKERGRGDIRLNDSCQSEGVFQSRLVMRASGSYRVLFNTHLWAEMKCEKANQKSIRITAQDADNIAVFLITGNNKDIQQLFSAVDHRIEALKLNAQHSSSETNPTEKEAQSRVGHESSSSDEEDKESAQEDAPSSPESTTETHLANFRQKAVSLLADRSECDGREGEGEEETGEDEAKQSEESRQSSSAAASGTT